MNDTTATITTIAEHPNVDCASDVVERLHSLEYRITKLEELVTEYEKKTCQLHFAKPSSRSYSHSSLEFKLALLQVMNAELTLLEHKLTNIAAPVSFVT
ncbi:hypothetical protein P879_09557 [Paragonimus westermani]|uniref:Uncharacterized protein n=1 Tax=Paragonimus westermani TaxID=34504 RepID=A0A8T0D5Z6_9TREM|nr:hypothetical protein P879_09557 [Paragonimus westermani]